MPVFERDGLVAPSRTSTVVTVFEIKQVIIEITSFPRR